MPYSYVILLYCHISWVSDEHYKLRIFHHSPVISLSVNCRAERFVGAAAKTLSGIYMLKTDLISL